MDIIIGLICGAIIGYSVRGIIYEMKRLRALKELDGAIDKTLSSLKEKIIPSRIEEENGMLFLYNKNTNEFLGQGKSLVELEHAVRTKYPDRLFNVTQAELDKFNKEPYENV